jgi:hypothetical protein
MTNALNRGEVQIILAGETRTLKPSLQAFQNIGSVGAYRDLLPRVTRCDLSAIAFVIRNGLGLTDDQARKLPEQLFETGLPKLAAPVAEYLFRLFNAGKSPEEVEAEAAAEADQGNAPAAG